MTAGPDDEFNQFLDMSSMGNMGDGNMQFDFQGFQDNSAHGTHGQHSQSMMTQSRQGDAIMADSDVSNMIPRSDGLLQNHTPAMSTSVSHPSIAAHMLATSGPPDSITNIDAQIQYLQQQKFHQQQRQLQEQQATFYSSHHHSVPPTPQSLEMPPGSGQFYSQPEQVPQRGAYDRSYHQRLAEQQDVRSPSFPYFVHEFVWLVEACIHLVINITDPMTTDGIHTSRFSCRHSSRPSLQHGKHLCRSWLIL